MEQPIEKALEPVEILRIRFPRMTQAEAVQSLLDSIEGEEAVGVAFPDMSTMNLAQADPSFKELLQTRVRVLNDGAALAWVARRLGRPFPENLNGTDLCPELLRRSPRGTRVFLLGATADSIERTRTNLAAEFEHLRIVGARDGYFSRAEEPEVVTQLRQAKPDIVLVGMGNPRQVEFIDRQLDEPAFKGTLFLAVGGFFDYWAKNITRAPHWLRRWKLEWLFIVMQQPRKIRRYLVGIPVFLIRCLVAEYRGRHACPPDLTTPSEPRA